MRHSETGMRHYLVFLLHQVYKFRVLGTKEWRMVSVNVETEISKFPMRHYSNLPTRES